MPNPYQYDVFLSHAVEDKIPIANDLCHRLQEAGLKIWYSGLYLNAGDSINQAVLDALDKSRYGVVILSSHYIDKNWTMKEYFHLIAREKNGTKVVLPVHFRITMEELIRKDLQMADRFAINAEKGLDYTVEKLVAIVRGNKQESSRSPLRMNVYTSLLWLLGIIILAFVIWSRIPITDPEVKSSIRTLAGETATGSDLSKEGIKALVIERQNMMLEKYKSAIEPGARKIKVKELHSYYNNYQNLKMRFRNEYEFDNGYKRIRAKKNVNASLGIQAELFNPLNSYQLSESTAYLMERDIPSAWVVEYVILNNTPLDFTILQQSRVNDSTYKVDLSFRNNIRFIQVDLAVDKEVSGYKRHKMFLCGFLPQESVFFVRRNGKWILS